jgi:hypothetical protein
MGHLRFRMNMKGRDRLWVYPVPIMVTVTNKLHWNYYGIAELTSVVDEHNRQRFTLAQL